MLNKKILFLAALVSTLSSFSVPTYAIDLQGYKFTDAYRYSFLDDTGFESFERPFVLNASFAHIKTPLFITDSRVTNYVEEVIKRYDLLTFGGSYRFSNYLSLGVETSFLKTKLKSTSESHFGDTHLKGKVLILKDQDQALALIPEFILPTGSQESFTTKKALSAAIRFSYEKHVERFHLLASLGLAHSPENTFSIINYRNLLLSELGLSYDLTAKWNVNLELNRNFTLASDYRQDEGDYYLTLKNKTTEDLSLYAGAGIAGFNSIDRKNWTAFVGLKCNFGDAQKAPIAPPVVPAPVKVATKPAPAPAPIIQIIQSASEEKKLFGSVAAFENIFFDNAKTNIKNSELLKIDTLITKISKHHGNVKHIVIEGYASKTGKAAKNQTLSLKRAQEVQKALINAGIAESLTSIVAYGDRSLKPDKEEAKNRKVQFRLYLQK